MNVERIEIIENEKLEIRIKPFYSESKQNLLIIWMILWTAAGLGIISQFFVPQAEGFTTYLIVWLAFWLYFEYKVIYAFRWRKYGLERIIVSEESLSISREISGRSIPSRYEVDFIKNLKKREVKESNFIYAMSKAYWNPGNENIEFLHKGKEVYFGLELEDQDAKRVIAKLSKKLKSLQS